jgi:hypothetical protein
VPPDRAEPQASRAAGALDRLDRRSYALSTSRTLTSVYDLMAVVPVVSRPRRGRRPGGRQPVGAGGPQAAARPAGGGERRPLRK